MASTTTTGPGRSEYRRTTLKKESSSISSIVRYGDTLLHGLIASSITQHSSLSTTYNYLHLHRDAKGLSLDLKSMLKRKHPSDREVEFQLEA